MYFIIGCSEIFFTNTQRVLNLHEMFQKEKKSIIQILQILQKLENYDLF